MPNFLIQSQKVPHSLSCFYIHVVHFKCFHISVCGGMKIQMASLAESLLAYPTLKVFLTSVFPGMTFQMTSLVESLQAYSTLKGFLSSVYAGMNSQMASPGKCLLAYSTLKWFLTSVGVEVIIAVVLARK